MSLLRRRMMMRSQEENKLIDGTYDFAIVSNNRISAVEAAAWKVASIPFENTFDIVEGDYVTITLSNIEYSNAYYHDLYLSNGTNVLKVVDNKNMTTQTTNTVVADIDYPGISALQWRLRGIDMTYSCDVSICVNDKRII